MTIHRRDLLKLSAVAAFHNYASSGLPGFCPRHPEATASTQAVQSYVPHFKWKNKHNNVKALVERYYEIWNRTQDGLEPTLDPWKAGLAGLLDAIRETEVLNKRIRAVGGTWSLSDAAVCPDAMINTMPLNYLAIGLESGHLHPAATVSPSQIVFAQCGVSVEELNEVLEANQLSLRTSGASNGQTICGAFSTGTHGSAVSLGAMQDYVLGIHIIVDGGKHYWLEPASKPIVSDSFCSKLGAELRRDDELFYAALVSFGSFGVIHAVLLEVEPIYTLRSYRRFVDWTDVRDAANTLNLTGLSLPSSSYPLFHFEIDLDPYAIARGQRGASVVVMYKESYTRTNRRPPKTVEQGFGVDTLATVDAISEVAPFVVPKITGTLFKTLFPEGEASGSRGEIFSSTAIKGKSLSAEIGIALADAVRAIEVLTKTAQSYHFPGLLALRYVRRSNALLAFTKFDPVTCAIELPAAGGHRTQEYYRRAWAALKANEIPYTLHWGQCNDFDAQTVRSMWGTSVDRWVTARNGFLSPIGRHMFSNDLLTRCKMDS